ncbi:T9SS type A sorting domain-containing protein, partial [bacterium]|nr:T9SS type A sorting domain-containing protein [bacterium]
MRNNSLLITTLSALLATASVWGQNTNRFLYTLNANAQTLSKMSLETRVIQNDIITVGETPNRIHACGDRVYVVNSTPPGITVIDAKTDQIVSNVNLPEGSNPWDMQFVEGEQVLVTSVFANAAFLYDLTTRDSLTSIAVGVAPQAIIVVGTTAYVGNTGGFSNGFIPSTVSVIDIPTLTVIKTIDVPLNPQALDLASDGTIHVVCTGNFNDVTGSLVIIDPNPSGTEFNPTVVDTLDFGGFPGGLAIANNGLGYLVDFGNGTNGFLYSYNTASREVTHAANDPILVGNGAIGISYDKSSDELYVANFSDDTVQSIDPVDGSVLNTFDFGDGPVDMVVVDLDQTTAVEGIDDASPGGFALSQNYPNPFNPTTRIEFSLPVQTRVRLNIYNLSGQLIRTLVDDTFQAGRFTATWEGRDGLGRPVASGTYIYTLTNGDLRASK